MTITDIVGKVIHSQVITARKGLNDVLLNLNAIAPQLLTVSLESDNTIYITQKLLLK
jgi:hypothetical protein